MTAAALLHTLTARGVVLTAEADRLRFRAPAGTITPELRRQIEAHKAALIEALAHREQAALFSPDPSPAPQGGLKGESIGTQSDNPSPAPATPRTHPHAARLVHGDFERARHRLADLEAELDAGASQLAGLPQPWPAELVDKLNGLASEADRLAPVAEYATFADLETATGAAYLAHCADKSNPALWETYRRLDDAWSIVLVLPEVTP